MTNTGETSVRRAIADGTAGVHEALHHHPHIARLAANDLQRDEYAALLVTYHAFYDAVEKSRGSTDAFAVLSLAPMIAALRHDIADLQQFTQVDVPSLNLRNPHAVLGALYVLHGAGFGGRTLATNVQRSRPLLPCRYLSAGTGKTLWRNLTAELEAYRDDTEGTAQIISSANETFHVFGAFVTESCLALAAANPRVVSGAA